MGIYSQARLKVFNIFNIKTLIQFRIFNNVYENFKL